MRAKSGCSLWWMKVLYHSCEVKPVILIWNRTIFYSYHYNLNGPLFGLKLYPLMLGLLQITVCVSSHVVWCHRRCSDWCPWPFTGMKTLSFTSCTLHVLTVIQSYWLKHFFSSVVTAVESEVLHRMLRSSGFLYTAAVNYRELNKLFLNSDNHVDVSQHQVTPFNKWKCSSGVS